MIRLAVRVRAEDAELALAELLVLAPVGVEEVARPAEGVVEYAVYGAPGELPELPDLRAAAGGALVEVSTTEVADDWAERWRAFHRPVEVGGRLVVRAPWHDPPADGALDVVIDPGRAFGTGAHATTRLCLEALLDLGRAGGPRPGPVADLGCGSGVLGIAAATLGWAGVTGYDHEPESVTATAVNAEVNGVDVAARRWDLRRDPVPEAPVVLANLLRPLLLTLAERMPRPPDVLVAGGLLRGEADEVAAAFSARHGLREDHRLERGDWAALVLRAG